MTPKSQPPVRLLTRANQNRCQHCPPERVCAWACVQGTSLPDIVVGAVLEQSGGWALEPSQIGPEVDPALWDTFNS